MTDREKLINQISGILLAHDCLTDEVQSEIFLALDLYEIRKRSTELIPADPMDNEAMIRDFAAAKAVMQTGGVMVESWVNHRMTRCAVMGGSPHLIRAGAPRAANST